ncbi:uncharacterized protein NECTIN3-AS1-like isoform X1 [Callithrix jacchus]|uniref:uncharacterized protein LOC100414943 n=1 Tax=Callithrix jacchus TaxID=9483 RepID=UPI001235DCC3|nr:uncharacterized protein LOC100414943 [Callithrix jacchus]
MLPVQRRKLDPFPKKNRHHKKTRRTKRMRKEEMEALRPLVHPTPSTPAQSEEDEAVDKKPAVLSAQQDNPDLLHEDRLQSLQEEGFSVMHQECQIRSDDLSVAQVPSSPTSPPFCFSGFLGCVCPTFSRSRKRSLPEGRVEFETWAVERQALHRKPVTLEISPFQDRRKNNRIGRVKSLGCVIKEFGSSFLQIQDTRTSAIVCRRADWCTFLELSSDSYKEIWHCPQPGTFVKNCLRHIQLSPSWFTMLT